MPVAAATRVRDKTRTGPNQRTGLRTSPHGLNGIKRGGVSSIECTMHVAVTDNEVICTEVSENMVCCEVLQWL